MIGGLPRRVVNCHADLMAYHSFAVALPRPVYGELRAKRDTVRQRIKRRLYMMDMPQPTMFRAQGSVIMETITSGGYYGSFDIDDGIYFSRNALKGPQGGDMSALAARQLVWEAAYSEQFAYPPEYRPNCVRVYYAAGYHVDFAVYRLTGSIFGGRTIELASSCWKPSNPAAVTDWFREASLKSPGWGANRQLTRMVRYLKVWCQSRSAWQGYMPSGFALTKLVAECYRAYPERDDRALLHLVWALGERLEWDSTVKHPVMRDEYLYGPGRDAKARFLRDRIIEARVRLRPIFHSANRQDARSCWDSFFNEDYFRSRPTVSLI